MKYIQYDYARIAQYLFELIDKTETGEKMLPVLKLAKALRQLLDDNLDGIGIDLVEWAGLKHDTPEMAKDYGEGIKKSFPELGL